MAESPTIWFFPCPCRISFAVCQHKLALVRSFAVSESTVSVMAVTKEPPVVRTYHMDCVGVIESKPDPPGIDRDKWIALISLRSDLVPPQPREITNPFTGEPATVFAPETTALLFLDGQDVGLFCWAENEENVLVVSGDLMMLRHVAEEIAQDLGGVFRTSDELGA